MRESQIDGVRSDIIKIVLGSTAVILTLLVVWYAIINANSSDTQSTNQINTMSITERDEIARTNLDYQRAYFAGGCFWCVEADFEKFRGIKAVISGYSGGESENPTYQDHAGHRETAEVVYDPEIISYEDLVRYFYRHHDPTDEGGSFGDRGFSYTSAIYYQNNDEEAVARSVTDELESSGLFDQSIVTAIEEFTAFYDAEDYHQDYYKESPIRYKGYRIASGREGFVDEVNQKAQDLGLEYGSVDSGSVSSEQMTNKQSVWAEYVKPSDDQLKVTLDDIVYRVTQREGTERPYTNEFKDAGKGIYVDILSGEPLFSSNTKFDSGTGWPSFYAPIDKKYVVEKTDYKLIFPRTEVRSKYGDNHLGHVFRDGPKKSPENPQATGLRYCMNGAALRFVPLEVMEAEGFGEYIDQVTK